jgi:DtxR family Mn-dependent transcriptional regulator
MSERYPLTESVEMYLKAIYQVVREKQAARAKDIALRLNVNSSSVTAALKHLSGRGFINYEPYDIITLTPEGMRVAREIVERGESIRKFLIEVLGIDPEEAEESACRMEHGVTAQVWKRLDILTMVLEEKRNSAGEEFRQEILRRLDLWESDHSE